MRVDFVGVRLPSHEHDVVSGRELRAVDAADRAGAEDDDFQGGESSTAGAPQLKPLRTDN